MELLSIIGTIMSLLGVGLVLLTRQKLLDKNIPGPDKSRHQRIFAAGILLLLLGVLVQLARVYDWI
ncbi:MAG: hypothetical protein AAGU11_09490 [Syntrophobacteraceae bacterium]